MALAPPTAASRIPELDGLRAVAALLVVWAHLPLLSSHWLGLGFHLGAGFFMAGHLGVDLFFALSGYLITSQLLRLREGGGLQAVLSFQGRRALRIFPLFYVVLAATALLVPDYGYLLPATYLANYGFASDLGPHPLRHAWSLAVEEQFYLLWPWIVLYAPQRHLTWIIGRLVPACAIAASLAIVTLVPQPLAGALVERGLESRMLTLALGASLALAPGAIAPARARWWLVGGLLCAVHLGVRLVPSGATAVLRHLGSAAIAVLVLDGIVNRASGARRPFLHTALRTPVLVWLGMISYGLYLFHFPIFFLVFQEAGDLEAAAAVPMALMAISLSIALAWLGHLLVERPCALLRRQWDRRKAAAWNGSAPGPLLPAGGHQLKATG